MHLKRLIVALIALPLLYLYVAKLSPPYFLALIVLVSVAAQKEFHAMYRTNGVLSLLGLICGTALLVGTAVAPYFLPPQGTVHFLPVLLMASFIAMTTARLLIVREPAFALRDVGPPLAGVFYIPILLLAQWYLRLKGYEWILFLYGCVWAADSLAYYVGKGIGRRRLYYSVSPNKTVEGAFGSVAGGVLAGVALGSLLMHHQTPALFALLGGTVGLTTIVGDLVESMFKRDAGMKDSGALIPGHGGILDKIDGSLFAGPVLYWVATAL